MARPRKTSETAPLDEKKALPDPLKMTEEELRAYVAKLEAALGAQAAKASPAQAKPWLEGEKRWVFIPRSPTNDVYTINGKSFVGRRLVTRETWDSLNEMHTRAVKSELSRMQTRGNLVPAHQLPIDDISSRSQPVTIGSIS